MVWWSSMKGRSDDHCVLCGYVLSCPHAVHGQRDRGQRGGPDSALRRGNRAPREHGRRPALFGLVYRRPGAGQHCGLQGPQQRRPGGGSRQRCLRGHRRRHPGVSLDEEGGATPPQGGGLGGSNPPASHVSESCAWSTPRTFKPIHRGRCGGWPAAAGAGAKVPHCHRGTERPHPGH